MPIFDFPSIRLRQFFNQLLLQVASQSTDRWRRSMASGCLPDARGHGVLISAGWRAAALPGPAGTRAAPPSARRCSALSERPSSRVRWRKEGWRSCRRPSSLQCCRLWSGRSPTPRLMACNRFPACCSREPVSERLPTLRQTRRQGMQQQDGFSSSTPIHKAFANSHVPTSDRWCWFRGCR